WWNGIHKGLKIQLGCFPPVSVTVHQRPQNVASFGFCGRFSFCCRGGAALGKITSQVCRGGGPQRVGAKSPSASRIAAGLAQAIERCRCGGSDVMYTTVTASCATNVSAASWFAINGAILNLPTVANYSGSGSGAVAMPRM